MIVRSRAFLIAAFLGYVLTSCAKEKTGSCTAVIPPVSVTGAPPCTPTGEIRFVPPPGSRYRFRLGQESFREELVYTGLRPGLYRVGIQEDAGCMADTLIRVPDLATGPLFTAVRQLLATHCTACHSGVNPQAGLDFSQDCDILAHALRIEARAVQGNPSPMPQAGLLPPAERQKITDWIRAGYGAGQ